MKVASVGVEARSRTPGGHGETGVDFLVRCFLPIDGVFMYSVSWFINPSGHVVSSLSVRKPK